MPLARSAPLLVGLALLAACHKKEELVEERPPEGSLALLAPAPGAWAPEGAATASGEAHDVVSVSVNGLPAALGDDGSFSTSVPLVRGINVVEATAVDGRGDTLFARHGVLAGSFGDPDSVVRDALRVRVNRGGLDKLCTLAEDMVTVEVVNGALGSMNPVLEDSYLGVDLTADVDWVSFGRPELRIEPSPAVVRLTAALPDLAVGIGVFADAGIVGTADFDLGMTASEVVVDAELIVAAGDGALGVTLSDATVEMRDFAYTIEGVPEWITDYAFVDTIRDTVQDMLREQIVAMVPPLVDETLAGLDPSFSMDLLGRTVALAFSFADAGSDDDGLVLDLDLDVDFPDSGDHTWEGFLLAPFGEPTLDTNADLAAAMSDDLLNLVVFEAWRSGILDVRMSTDDGSLDPLLLSEFKAESGTITTFATLPPAVVERDGALVVQVGEVLVTVDTPGGELGEHLVVAVHGEVPLGLAIEGGALTLDIGTPTLVMMVRESDWGADEETVTRLIEAALPLDSLLALLGTLSFDLPVLYGVSIDSGVATRDADGVHTDAEIFLR